MTAPNPYTSQPPQAFWRSAVANRNFIDLDPVWKPMDLKRSDRVATAGSCFAQHIGNNLAKRGANYIDLEPAPEIFTSKDEAKRFGFGIFSCRYGNIYTSRQLLQLFDEAHGNRVPLDRVWKKGDRFYDALRPAVEPVGQETFDAVVASRSHHLECVRKMFASLDVFVFTMGLTEGWESTCDQTMYPMAPGTVCGQYDADNYVFHNMTHSEILNDMIGFWERLKSVNPQARMLLTVSPVPLAATATSDHVLVATTYSKSVLRAVAGELTSDNPEIHYFPSYEIISSHPARGMFYNPDLRAVCDAGVAYVMKHFFSAHLAVEFGDIAPATEEETTLVCEEELLDQSGKTP